MIVLFCFVLTFCRAGPDITVCVSSCTSSNVTAAWKRPLLSCFPSLYSVCVALGHSKNSGACVTCISLAWYTMIRPSRMIVERLIRHFRANEYSEACNTVRWNTLERSTFQPPSRPWESAPSTWTLTQGRGAGGGQSALALRCRLSGLKAK